MLKYRKNRASQKKARRNAKQNFYNKCIASEVSYALIPQPMRYFQLSHFKMRMHQLKRVRRTSVAYSRVAPSRHRIKMLKPNCEQRKQKKQQPYNVGFNLSSFFLFVCLLVRFYSPLA